MPETTGDEGFGIDEDLSEIDPDEEDEEAWTEMPITDEERAEGKARELAKMSKFKTFKPVPKAQAVDGPILDSTWVEARKPDKSVRMRYCLRDFKSNSYRDDVYAVSTTSATGRMIDLIGAMMNYWSGSSRQMQRTHSGRSRSRRSATCIPRRNGWKRREKQGDPRT